MAEYGLTSSGFIPKRLEDIKADVEAALIEKFGEIDLEPDSVFGQIIGVLSSQLTEIWEQMDVVYKSQSPASAEGAQLDDVVSLTNIQRFGATESRVVIQVNGDESSVLPAGSIVSQEITGTQFETDSELIVSKDTLHKAELSFEVNNSTEYSLDINSETISYTSTSSADFLEIASCISDLISDNDNLNETVECEIDTDNELIIIKIIDSSSLESFSISNLIELSLDNIWSPISITCLLEGNIAVPAGSINKLDTSVSGISNITNISEGTPGRNIEEDDALRIRRIESISALSSSTLASIVAIIKNEVEEVTDCFGYENVTDDVVSGMLPHSFEIIVDALNNSEINDKIAKVIWENKPSGIATNGNTSIDIEDINGDNQIVKFSHATNKYVHIELTYDTADSDNDFPVNGEQLIKDRLVEIGDGYTFGSDVLIQVISSASYASTGVSNSTARIAVTDNPEDTPAWQTSNIRLDKQYLPKIDESRITLVKA